MGDIGNTADSNGRGSRALAHGFMTLVADESRLLGVVISPPSGVVNWVVQLLAYPCDLSIHLDRAGLELLADRIEQALLDDCIVNSGREPASPDRPDADGEDAGGFMAGPHDPHKRSPGADDEGVDLDDPAMMGGPEDPADPAHLGGI